MALIEKQKIAGMNHIFRFYTVDDYFESLQKNGFQSAELWTNWAHFMLDSSTYQDARKMKKKAQSYGLDIVCITPQQCCPNTHNIASKNPILIERTFKYFSNAIKAASEMDCPQVLITPGWAFLSEDVNEAWSRSIDMVQKLCEVAKKNGISLTMETLKPQESRIVNSKETMRKMLDKVSSDALNVTIDLGALSRSGETIQDYFDEFGSKITHVHFVDTTKDGKLTHLCWGDGERNLVEDLTVFKNNGYDGYFTLEYSSGDYFENPDFQMKKTMSLLTPYF